MENPIIRIAAKLQYKKIPSLRTVAVMDIISWSRGRPQRKGQCTFLQRSWSRKAPVDVKTFLRPYLRNWCWKPFTAGKLSLLLLSVMILIIGLLVLRLSTSSLLQRATAYFITYCDGLLLQSATIITRCYRKRMRMIEHARSKLWWSLPRGISHVEAPAVPYPWIIPQFTLRPVSQFISYNGNGNDIDLAES